MTRIQLCCLAGLALAVCLAACTPAAPPEVAKAEPAPAAPEGPPLWAYPVNPPAPAPANPPAAVAPAARPPADPTLRHVEGSTAAFTSAQIRNLFAAPDWFPASHAPMPEVVAHGRRPDVMACGFCHLPTGDGRPENASLSGLPASYIIEQMAAFKADQRNTSVDGRTPWTLMHSIAKAASDAEVAEAAAYFAALSPKSHTEIVETDTAPKTHVQAWIPVKSEPADTEPLGQRIVETPEDFARFELRDPNTKYVAYVPPGSPAKGKALAAIKRGGEKQTCADCHGVDFHGIGATPGLAGRSPSYLVRQLYDFQSGVRGGPNSEKMKPILAGLTNTDMLELAAFLASQAP